MEERKWIKISCGSLWIWTAHDNLTGKEKWRMKDEVKSQAIFALLELANEMEIPALDGYDLL